MVTKHCTGRYTGWGIAVWLCLGMYNDCTYEFGQIGLLVQWNLTHPNLRYLTALLIQHDSCICYLMLTGCMEQSSCLKGAKMPEF